MKPLEITDLTYVDAFLDRKTDTIRITERQNGARVLKDVPASYVFYYENDAGSHRSIFGHSVKRHVETSSAKFRMALSQHVDKGETIFESDVNPVFRYLSEHYTNVEAPKLNLGFFDIEADFHAEDGFAPPSNPFNAITAISLYTSVDEKLLTLLLKPPTYEQAAAQSIVDQFEDTLLFDDECELLKAFLDAIDDVDVLTSWNGSAYDIPYTVNRVARMLNRDATRRFCLWGQLPSEREYMNKFGKTVETFDLVGRVHLDYLELYAKHNPKQHLSYALNAIGEEETKETKTVYRGSLDDLYKKDFPTFIEYNRQDVMLMVKIDQKLKYIELANQVAHANGVVLKTTMGSVALVEQAIINEMHLMDFVVPCRKEDIDDCVVEIDDLDDDEDEDVPAWDWKKVDVKAPVVGAYVANPKAGLHKNVGCVDINSLYPSAIRALNMSPETLVGQVRLDATMQLINDRVAKLTKTKRAEAWDGLFATLEVSCMHDQTDDLIIVDFFDLQNNTTTTRELSGKQLYQYIFDPDNHVCITANGTIFRTDVEGIIPKLLGKWITQRKEMQAKQKDCEKHKDLATTPEEKKEAEYWVDFWNQRQQARKILLNSLYGALLNEACRFYDERCGQSTTLSGRSIVQHMNASINQVITGSYDYRGDALIAADTDSAYFTIENTWRNNPLYTDFDWSPENVINLYDVIADETNRTFPEYMRKTFNTSLENGGIIRAGRELMGSTALFIKKKKYAILMIDKEGTRLDTDGPGKLKIMGLDLKRSDTPKYMQKFLETLLLDILIGKDQTEMYADIKAFRKLFKDRPGWEKGSPKKVSNLSGYTDKRNKLNKALLLDGNKKRVKDEKKFMLPGHVLASMNWNKLRDVYHDKHTMPISDGTRIIVCKLARNSLNMTAMAYPIDEPHLPAWFMDLPFDHLGMEEAIIDKKIGNLTHVLDWNLTDTKEKAADDLFTWS
jgi:DNA polymerase elongation subunit (family B)